MKGSSIKYSPRKTDASTKSTFSKQKAFHLKNTQSAGLTKSQVELMKKEDIRTVLETSLLNTLGFFDQSTRK